MEPYKILPSRHDTLPSMCLCLACIETLVQQGERTLLGRSDLFVRLSQRDISARMRTGLLIPRPQLLMVSLCSSLRVSTRLFRFCKGSYDRSRKPSGGPQRFSRIVEDTFSSTSCWRSRNIPEYVATSNLDVLGIQELLPRNAATDPALVVTSKLIFTWRLGLVQGNPVSYL